MEYTELVTFCDWQIDIHQIQWELLLPKLFEVFHIPSTNLLAHKNSSSSTNGFQWASP